LRTFLSFLIAAACLMLVAGCGVTTGYAKANQPHKWWLYGGYSEERTGKDQYKIRVQGDVLDRAEKIRNFALLRAAELGLENGTLYFVIVHRQDNLVTTGFGVRTSGPNLEQPYAILDVRYLDKGSADGAEVLDACKTALAITQDWEPEGYWRKVWKWGSCNSLPFVQKARQRS